MCREDKQVNTQDIITGWLKEYLNELLMYTEVDGKIKVISVDLEKERCILEFPLIVIESDEYAGFAGY